MSNRSVVRDENETPVCTVVAFAPETSPEGRKILRGAIRLEFGQLSLAISDKTAVEWAQQLLNAATIAQGAARMAA